MTKLQELLNRDGTVGVSYPIYTTWPNTSGEEEVWTTDYPYSNDWVKHYLNPPSKVHFFQEFVDITGGVVDVEFVLAGFNRSQISVKISSEKKTITILNKESGLELVSREIENKKNIDLSKKVTSVLKDGLLKISIPILQKEKDLEVEVN